MSPIRPITRPQRSPALHRLLILLCLGIPALARAQLSVVERWPTGENVCIDAPLRITFNQPPALGQSGRIEVLRASDRQPVETIELGAAEYVDRIGSGSASLLRYEPVRTERSQAIIRLRAGSLQWGETYIVQIAPGVLNDAAEHDFGGINDGWKFTTKPPLPQNPDQLTVSADGSADFCTVQGAVNQLGPRRARPVVINIRNGRYDGLVRISREQRHVRLVGEDRQGVLIVARNNDKLNPGLIQRAVLGVEGDDFSLENVTVQNTTPYKGSQAEAIYIKAERCILKNANFLSFQDTLDLNGRVYVHNCYIEGDVDYVWGYGFACFDDCELHTMHDGYCVQARNPPGKPGYIFRHCRISAEPGVKKLWLARVETDRFPASHVAFFNCRMAPQINSAGWLVTGEPSSTLRFEEHASLDLDGHPLDLSKRAPFSKQLTPKETVAEEIELLLSDAPHEVYPR